MSEWTVVTVLIAVIGLFATILKPVLTLNSTIIRLDESVNVLKQKLESLTANQEQSHIQITAALEALNSRLLSYDIKLQNMDITRKTSGSSNNSSLPQ